MNETYNHQYVKIYFWLVTPLVEHPWSRGRTYGGCTFAQLAQHVCRQHSHHPPPDPRPAPKRTFAFTTLAAMFLTMLFKLTLNLPVPSSSISLQTKTLSKFGLGWAAV